MSGLSAFCHAGAFYTFHFLHVAYTDGASYVFGAIPYATYDAFCNATASSVPRVSSASGVCSVPSGGDAYGKNYDIHNDERDGNTIHNAGDYNSICVKSGNR